MTDLKTIVTAHARACGFDLVGVTSADDFAADRDAALERIREGRMDGLPWYTDVAGDTGHQPNGAVAGGEVGYLLGVELPWG